MNLFNGQARAIIGSCYTLALDWRNVTFGRARIVKEEGTGRMPARHAPLCSTKCRPNSPAGVPRHIAV